MKLSLGGKGQFVFEIEKVWSRGNLFLKFMKPGKGRHEARIELFGVGVKACSADTCRSKDFQKKDHYTGICP